MSSDHHQVRDSGSLTNYLIPVGHWMKTDLFAGCFLSPWSQHWPTLHQQAQLRAFRPHKNWFRTWAVDLELAPKNSWFFGANRDNIGGCVLVVTRLSLCFFSYHWSLFTVFCIFLLWKVGPYSFSEGEKITVITVYPTISLLLFNSVVHPSTVSSIDDASMKQLFCRKLVETQMPPKSK